MCLNLCIFGIEITLWINFVPPVLKHSYYLKQSSEINFKAFRISLLLSTRAHTKKKNMILLISLK